MKQHKTKRRKGFVRKCSRNANFNELNKSVRSLTGSGVKTKTGRWMTKQRESGRGRDCRKERKRVQEGSEITRNVTLKDKTKLELFLSIRT